MSKRVDVKSRQTQSVSTKRTPRQKTAKVSGHQPVKTSRGIGILILLFIVICACIVAFIVFRKQAETTTQQRIETYLEEKYKRQFVVGKPERKANGFGVEGHEEAIVHPVGDENLTFTATTNSIASGDTYVSALWRRDERPDLEAKLAEVYGYVPEYKLDINLNVARYPNDFRYVPPYSFKETQEHYPDILWYSLDIKEASTISVDDQTRTNAARKLYHMIEYINEKSLGSWGVSYFGSTDNGASYGVSASEKDFEAGITIDWLKGKFRFLK